MRLLAGTPLTVYRAIAWRGSGCTRSSGGGGSLGEHCTGLRPAIGDGFVGRVADDSTDCLVCLGLGRIAVGLGWISRVTWREPGIDLTKVPVLQWGDETSQGPSFRAEGTLEWCVLHLADFFEGGPSARDFGEDEFGGGGPYVRLSSLHLRDQSRLPRNEFPLSARSDPPAAGRRRLADCRTDSFDGKLRQNIQTMTTTPVESVNSAHQPL